MWQGRLCWYIHDSGCCRVCGLTHCLVCHTLVGTFRQDTTKIRGGSILHIVRISGGRLRVSLHTCGLCYLWPFHLFTYNLASSFMLIFRCLLSCHERISNARPLCRQEQCSVSWTTQNWPEGPKCQCMMLCPGTTTAGSCKFHCQAMKLEHYIRRVPAFSGGLLVLLSVGRLANPWALMLRMPAMTSGGTP